MRAALTRRALVLVVASLIFGSVGIGSALGIVYGEPDAGEHPYVGSIVVRVPEFEEDGSDLYVQWCSGTLLDREVFLTASHCLVGLDELLPPGFEILVTFDEIIDPENGTFFDGSDFVTHPLFFSHGWADTFDIAVIRLDGVPAIPQYGMLPEARLLDEMNKRGELRQEEFTAVGYGVVRDTRRKAFQSILPNARRNKADQTALSLTKAWLTLSMNQATGDAGTCYGDSGGPHFLKGTNLIVSLTVTGDTMCKATDKTYRLDTASARDFLDNFVQLP